MNRLLAKLKDITFAIGAIIVSPLFFVLSILSILALFVFYQMPMFFAMYWLNLFGIDKDKFKSANIVGKVFIVLLASIIFIVALGVSILIFMSTEFNSPRS